jgi:serine/threonine protein kinase
MDGLLDGRYRLGERLGRGGAADVYEAEDLRLERHVAVKVYRPFGDDIGLRRFLTEAELLAGLSHPGLLTVFDVNVDDDRPYLVLQLAPGGTLREKINDGPLTSGETATIGAELAEVLAHVHANHVVHRDVKPSNVLFDRTGASFLADFGIARALGAAHLTDSNEFIGTAAYLAPEQVVDREVGPLVDVYALGLVLLECLTGETEYVGTDVEVAIARLSRAPRIPDTLPAEWRSLLSAMTAFEPEGRPNARRCAKRLRALAPLTVALPVPVSVSARSRRGVYAGLGALAAAGAVAALLASGTTAMPGHPVGDPASVVRPTVTRVVDHSTATATAAVTVDTAPTTVVPAAQPPAATGGPQAGNTDDQGDSEKDKPEKKGKKKG